MKKILMGLVAMSVASFSTLNQNDPATTQTNLWQTGEEGRISVKGKLITTPSDVKYVIFTSPDGTLTEADDILTIPEFTISQNYNIPTMKGTPNKIYVKKLNSDGSISNLTTEFVTFTFANYDPEFKYYDNLKINFGDIVDMPVFGFLKKVKIIELLTAAFGSEGTVSTSYTGDPAFTPKGGSIQIYRLPRKFNLVQSSRGVLEMFMNDNNYYASANNMTLENAKKFEKLFSTAQSGSIAIKARVDLVKN